MIRFPPTSIALSDSDIDFHLREIQIKEQLYAQGFTKKEVHRYYSQRQGDINNVNDDDDDDDDDLSSRTPSCAFAKASEQSANLSVRARDSRRTSGRPMTNSKRVSSDGSRGRSDLNSNPLFQRKYQKLTGTGI